MMKKLLLLLLFLASPALAESIETPEPEQDARVHMSEINPDRNVGYTVGDILSRTIILEVKKPYELVKTSLPIVGYERRWQGQLTGIDLQQIGVEQNPGADNTTYTLHLAYQVFTNNVVAKPAALPAEIIQFSGGGKLFKYRIPSWNFRISPLAVYGSVKIENDMSPFRGPLLLDASAQAQRLKVLSVIFGLSLLGLLYVLGANFWLPRMGGPFARAYRDLRKLPATDNSLQQAVTRVHQALNLSAGNSVFGADGFVERKPGFAPVKADLEKFFNLSRSVFFDPDAPHDLEQPPMAWLRQFCLACRHCERGLK